MSNVWVKSQVQTWPLTICVLTRGKVVCQLSFHFTCLLNPVEQLPQKDLNWKRNETTDKEWVETRSSDQLNVNLTGRIMVYS